MRILFVDQFSEIGGAQRCFLDLFSAIKERGWSVQAALPGRGPLVSLLNAVPIACGPYRSGSKSGADAVRFALDAVGQMRTLSGLIAKGGFDLLYVNGPRVLLGAALASRGRVPILFHAHHFLHRSYWAALAGWSVRRDIDRVVACSEFVAGPLRRYVAPSRLQVVHNGSADLGYRQRSFEPPWRIGIVGRIEPPKGQAEFVEAARQIPDARFFVYGPAAPTASAYYDRVRALAQGLPVELLGWQEDRAALFARLDLLVIASQQEGFPLVMLEAFSAGVPVVAFSVGGIPEAVQHGNTGFLIAERSSHALASEIQKLMAGSRQKLIDVAASARTLWERSFNIGRYQERMIEALHRAARP